MTISFPANITELGVALEQANRSKLVTNLSEIDIRVLRLDGEGIAAGANKNHDEVIYVVEGEAVFEVEGDPIALRKGDLFNIKAGAKHCVLPGGRGILLIAHSNQDTWISASSET